MALNAEAGLPFRVSGAAGALPTRSARQSSPCEALDSVDSRQPGAQPVQKAFRRLAQSESGPDSLPLRTLATVPLILNEPAQNGAQVWAIEANQSVPRGRTSIAPWCSVLLAAVSLGRSFGRRRHCDRSPRHEHRGEGGAKEAH